MEIPQVIFFGQLLVTSGPMQGHCIMKPALDVVFIEDTLVTTREYEFDLDEEGKFRVEVLPTNVGCDIPWQYYFQTPMNSFAIALPMTKGPHNFKTLLGKGQKKK